jgi:putative DNA methylase
MTDAVIPFSLKKRPALIERLLPVQKLSAEVFKERKAGAGQTLVPLGAYWKGRKPLILNKACILGCLLPATENPARDLEIFEKLMAMDEESFAVRWKRRLKPKDILAALAIARPEEYFTFQPPDFIPYPSPWDWSRPEFQDVQVDWRNDIAELDRRRLETAMLPRTTYRERVEHTRRPEEVSDTVHDHIWNAVNDHLGTSAYSFPDLVEQLGIMRFGHRPKVADTFCGSGQIPFEAARIGCDVYASDLNPVACMLTWGSFHIVGSSWQQHEAMENEQKQLAAKVLEEIDKLGVETDGSGWRAKAYLYCLEVRCPQTGWMVPLIPSKILSFGKQAIVDLIPVPSEKRYENSCEVQRIACVLSAASKGTLRSDGRGQEPYLIHSVMKRLRTKISTLGEISEMKMEPQGTNCDYGKNRTTNRFRRHLFRNVFTQFIG